MQKENLTSRNLDLTRLLEKAAAVTIERDIADKIQGVLTEELHHRMKNMLAVVTAIVRQSLRTAPSLAEAENSISTRLVAMASAHNLLLKADLKSAKMTKIVSGAIAQHDADADHILVNGEEIEILSTAVVPITLLLNELCTNASKYGALSKADGRVFLNWVQDAAANSITLRWVEKGGPPVAPPGPKSFGTRLIEDALPRQLGGHGKLSFPVSGVEFEFVVPSENLCAEALA